MFSVNTCPKPRSDINFFPSGGGQRRGRRLELEARIGRHAGTLGYHRTPRRTRYAPSAFCHDVAGAGTGCARWAVALAAKARYSRFRMTRAIRFSRTGGPDVLELEEISLPEPKAGEALVRHRAIGVNFIDTYHRSGLYSVPLPSGLGSEAAGVVEQVGPGVTTVRVGERVAYATACPGPALPGGARASCRPVGAAAGRYLR